MSTAIELFLAPTGAATKSSFASGRMVCVAVLGIRTPANVVRRDEAGRETSMICTCAPRGSPDRLMTSGFEQQNPGTGVALDGGFHTLTIEPALSRRRVDDLTAVMCVSTDPCKRCATAGAHEGTARWREQSRVAGRLRGKWLRQRQHRWRNEDAQIRPLARHKSSHRGSDRARGELDVFADEPNAACGARRQRDAV